MLGDFRAEIGAGLGVIRDGMGGFDLFGGFGSGGDIHIKNTVTGEESVIEVFIGESGHLGSDRGVARDVKFDAARKSQDVSDAFARIMIGVITSFNGLDLDITKIESLVFPVCESLGLGDDTAIGIAILDLVKIRMIVVGMSDQNKIGG